MSKHLAKTISRNTAHIPLRGTRTAPALVHITPPSRASASSSIRTSATLSAPLQFSSKLTTKLIFKPTNPYTPTQAKTMSTSVSQAPNPPPRLRCYPAASELRPHVPPRFATAADTGIRAASPSGSRRTTRRASSSARSARSATSSRASPAPSSRPRRAATTSTSRTPAPGRTGRSSRGSSRASTTSSPSPSSTGTSVRRVSFAPLIPVLKKGGERELTTPRLALRSRG